MNKSKLWFWLGILLLFLWSLGLRIWGLNRFHRLVFDEIYYAEYANDYLNQISFYDVHPPLGKYFIALGIWLTTGGNITDISQVDGFNYRWMNAFIGALVPVIIAGIAYQLSKRRSYALTAGFLTALDGLLIVESRLALINIYLVFFGCLAQFLFLLSLNSKGIWGRIWRILAGICFGASFSVKWNGLGFLLGIYLLIAVAWLTKWWRWRQIEQSSGTELEKMWEKLSNLTLLEVISELIIIPAITYYLIWIPHLRINQEFNFLQLHKTIWQFNMNMGSGTDVHPYCSRWYTWPLMMRPIAYYYNREPGPPSIIQDVHAMGNPVLWWLSTIAIISLIGWLAIQLKQFLTVKKTLTPPVWIALFILLNYCANFLPWMKVERCTFIYLYMGASVFGFLALSWIVDSWLRSDDISLRFLGIIVVVSIISSFIFWLPLYLGLPLSSEGFIGRMWFESWY